MGLCDTDCNNSFSPNLSTFAVFVETIEVEARMSEGKADLS